jgi:hypothetical protein
MICKLHKIKFSGILLCVVWSNFVPFFLNLQVLNDLGVNHLGLYLWNGKYMLYLLCSTIKKFTLERFLHRFYGFENLCKFSRLLLGVVRNWIIIFISRRTIIYLSMTVFFMFLWSRWVDEHLVHVLSPNIYRSTSEALESFDYIAKHGKSPQLSSSMFPVIHCFFLIMCYHAIYCPS